MGLLDKLFGRGKQAPVLLRPAGPCRHPTLVPSWGSVADMGEGDKISGYRCDGCHASFTAAEGRAVRQSEAERSPTDVSV